MRDVSYDAGDGRKRDDFTMDEQRKILLAARDANPTIKWLTFLSAFALTRTSEIADAAAADICERDNAAQDPPEKNARSRPHNRCARWHCIARFWMKDF